MPATRCCQDPAAWFAFFDEDGVGYLDRHLLEKARARARVWADFFQGVCVEAKAHPTCLLGIILEDYTRIRADSLLVGNSFISAAFPGTLTLQNRLPL